MAENQQFKARKIWIQGAWKVVIWVFLTVIVAEGGPFCLVWSEGGWQAATKYLGNSQIGLIAASIYLATASDLLTEGHTPAKGWWVFFGWGCLMFVWVSFGVISDFVWNSPHNRVILVGNLIGVSSLLTYCSIVETHLWAKMGVYWKEERNLQMFTEFTVGFWLYMAAFVGLTLYTLIGFIFEIRAASRKASQPDLSKHTERAQPSVR